MKYSKTIAIILVNGLFLFFLTPYLINHQAFEKSKDQNDWSEFGLYLGGTLGVLLAGFTAYLLYITLKKQRKQ